MSNKLTIVATAVLGIIVGGVAYHTLIDNPTFAAVLERLEGKKEGTNESKVKYWVAPMDDNYRRDKPGKSPMGMDLVPVYEEEKTATVEKKVKYWVAPMDDNYRRDKPGKSPMGMDLVPVYEEENLAATERKIKYWVAPMDDNFRRDEPGKSPMGMDLVPVYEENNMGEVGPGTVRISSSVVNNLGVRTGIVKTGYLNTTLNTVGYVQFDQSQLSHVHSRVSGWIEKLYVEAEGDYIERGQRLYDLYSPELLNAQEEYILALGRANKNLVEAAESRLKALQLPNFVIKALKKDKKVRQTVPVYAQKSGVVGDLKISNGFYIKPEMTLLSISNLEKIWVEAEVFERQLQLVTKGDKATVTSEAYPGRSWQGVIDFIYPVLDPKTRTLKVRIGLENIDQLLKPNMYMQVSFKHSTEEEILLLPKEAVIRTGNSNRVVVDLGDGQFKSVNVQTGRFSDNSVELLSGVLEGDKVVIAAQFLIDSESSKSSDFLRMMPDQESTMVDHTKMGH